MKGKWSQIKRMDLVYPLNRKKQLLITPYEKGIKRNRSLAMTLVFVDGIRTVFITYAEGDYSLLWMDIA